MLDMPAYLASPCSNPRSTAICYECKESVKQNPETCRWFITMGHPGFNSPANNVNGYKYRATALARLRFYGKKGARFQ